MSEHETKPGAVDGITVHEGGAVTIVGEQAIGFFRLLALRGAVKLEGLGMKHSSRRSITAQCKREFGIKGNRDKVLAWLEAEIERRRAEGK